VSATQPRRRRRTPEAARQEILDAAESMLAERPVRDLAIDELMATTTLRRSSFYVYFEDRGALMLGLLDRIEGQMMGAATPWFELPRESSVAQAVDALEASILEVMRVFETHGAVIAALADAAVLDEKVEAIYRGVTVQHLIDAVARRLTAERRAGRSDVRRPAETARALILMNERYAGERLGRAPRRAAREVASVLQPIWVAAIYGNAADRPSHG
jgi:AcrR family transcriptional regulator